MNKDEVVQKIETLMGGNDRVDIDINDPSVADIIGDLRKAKFRLDITKADGLVVKFPRMGETVMTIHRVGANGNAPAAAPKAPKAPEKKAKAPTKRPKPKRHQHSYVPPAVAADIVSILLDDASHIVQLVGPTQCGKSTVARYVGRELGRKVFQVNCRGDMGSEAFLGEKTVEVDEDTGQNHIVYMKGIVEKAMTEGLDESGNEVGEPGVLFIDEFASCPSHVLIAMNRFFESDESRRTLVLDQDGGRMVRSHSGLRVILASNTSGRGAMGVSDAMYTAQMDALDVSTLKRVAATFRLGYDKKVEKHILMEKVGDDKVTQMVMKFREAIREHIKAGKLSTPFTTKDVVKIADMYRIFGDLAKAIYVSVVESLLPEERATYNETVMAITGKDMMKSFVQNGIDFM
jgi:MoxR-like ATPase